MPDAIDAGTIQSNAEGLRRASGGGVSAEQHSLPDQIAADKYIETKRATRHAFWPFRMFQIRLRDPY